MTFVLLSAGCSDGDAGTQPTPSTSGGQSVAETTTPSPTQTVQPPVMPAAAKKSDLAGAEAFIRYYFDTVNYAYATGDLERTQSIRASDCAACKSLEDGIRKGYANDQRLQGGHVEVGDVVVTPGDLSKGADINVVAEQATADVIGPDGNVVDQYPGTPKAAYRFLLDYDDGWVVSQWGNYEVGQ
jgi:hypothetical protein